MRTYKVTWKFRQNYEAAKKVFDNPRHMLIDHDDATLTTTLTDEAIAVLQCLSTADLCTIEYLPDNDPDKLRAFRCGKCGREFEGTLRSYHAAYGDEIGTHYYPDGAVMAVECSGCCWDDEYDEGNPSDDES